MTKEKRLFTYDNRNSRDGDDIALISVLLQYAAGDGAEGENAGIERHTSPTGDFMTTGANVRKFAPGV